MKTLVVAFKFFSSSQLPGHVGSGASPSSASFGFSAGSVAPAPEGRPGLSAPHVGEYVGFDTERREREE